MRTARIERREGSVVENGWLSLAFQKENLGMVCNEYWDVCQEWKELSYQRCYLNIRGE